MFSVLSIFPTENILNKVGYPLSVDVLRQDMTNLISVDLLPIPNPSTQAEKTAWREDLVYAFPDSKVHGANMGPIWGRQDPAGPPVGPMNFATWVITSKHRQLKPF